MRQLIVKSIQDVLLAIKFSSSKLISVYNLNSSQLIVVFDNLSYKILPNRGVQI
jgi:hypothetical protein